MDAVKNNMSSKTREINDLQTQLMTSQSEFERIKVAKAMAQERITFFKAAVSLP